MQLLLGFHSFLMILPILEHLSVGNSY